MAENVKTNMDMSEIKAYVSDFASAEEIVNQLKEKESTNAFISSPIDIA